MMDIGWKDNEERFKELEEAFNAIGPDVIFMSHYDLSITTGISANEWREFLVEPRVSDWIHAELTLYRQAELRKMTKNISKNSKSVGTAQTINALNTMLKSDKVKEGPIFIYTYVPLTTKEQAAPHVRWLDEDPFVQRLGGEDN